MGLLPLILCWPISCLDHDQIRTLAIRIFHRIWLRLPLVGVLAFFTSRIPSGTSPARSSSAATRVLFGKHMHHVSIGLIGRRFPSRREKRIMFLIWLIVRILYLRSGGRELKVDTKGSWGCLCSGILRLAWSGSWRTSFLKPAAQVLDVISMRRGSLGHSCLCLVMMPRLLEAVFSEIQDFA